MASTASDTALDIASRALVLIGAEPITSFESNSTEALVASNMYEDVVRSSLCVARWRFATEQSTLNQITEAPTGRFAIAHQLPSNLLMLHTVTVNDNILGYTVYGDKVFSDASTSDVLIADYTYRSPETDFPSYFSLAVQYSLAGVFATAIARDDNLALLMDGKADRLMAKARNLDSQQQTTRSLSTTRFATNRRS